MNTKDFCKKLKTARMDKGLSQRSLGLSLGLSDKTISSYESGRSFPSLDILYKLSTVLDKPLEYFILTPSKEFNVEDKLNKVINQQKAIQKELDEITKILKQEV